MIIDDGLDGRADVSQSTVKIDFPHIGSGILDGGVVSVIGGGELIAGGFFRTDIFGQGDDADFCPCGIVNHGCRQADGNQTPVFVQANEFLPTGSLAVSDPLDVRSEFRLSIGGDDGQELPHGFLGSPTEEAFGRGVPHGDAPFEVDGVDAYGRGVDEGATEFVAFIEFALSLLESGVIVNDRQQQWASIDEDIAAEEGDVADGAIGESMLKFEVCALSRSGSFHLSSDDFRGGRVDVADAFRAQLVACPAIEAAGVGVGIDDRLCGGVDEQADSVVVFEQGGETERCRGRG